MNEIQDKLAREFLLKAEASMKKAEASMDKKEYENVISYATAGLEVIFEKAKNFFFNDRFDYLKEGEVENLGKVLNETVICYSLGINIELYVRYRKMAGYFSILNKEPMRLRGGMFSGRKLSFNQEDAQTSLKYCTKTIIEIEKTLEKLNKPLNEE